MNDKAYTFRNFIIEEMKRREMSERQFGALVGVSHTTINRAIDENDPAAPGIEFLLKLSRATGTSLLTLVGMAYPDLFENVPTNPSTQILAERINQLPDHAREAVIALIMDYRPGEGRGNMKKGNR